MAELSLQLLDGLLQCKDLVEERALQRLIKRRQLLVLRRVSLLLQLPPQAVEDLQDLHFLCSRVFRHFGSLFSSTFNPKPGGSTAAALTWTEVWRPPHLGVSPPRQRLGGASGALAPGRLRACKSSGGEWGYQSW